MRSAAKACPARLYDDPGAAAPERVVCIREPPIKRAWTFLCRPCFDKLLNAKARREEWELEP